MVANGDFLDHLAKHRNIGLTKTIDRLLGITNDEQAIGIKRLIRVWAIAHEVGEDFPLQSAGVLEFINLDKAIAFFQVCDDGGRALEKPENAPGDGIKVVGVFLQAEGFILLIDLCKDKHQIIASQQCLLFQFEINPLCSQRHSP